MQHPPFQSAPASLCLAPGEVHVWLADIREASPAMQASLSAEEWIRAERFHFDEHRRKFIAAHGCLRLILARYIAQLPSALAFEVGPHGKPALAGHLLRFNLSHSGDFMLLAITHAREVGIDLEAIRDAPDIESLAEHYFAPEDQWTLRTLPPEQRPRHFFEIWTRTEALLKARGCGLSGLDAMPDAASYTVLRIEIGPNYVGCLAVEGKACGMCCFRWHET
jgi:4'-phosphopantetheinyl transferase